ncbi:hypothetical protein CPB83DRAFT_855541 [Crepidotus variabilis]|uniref:Uncharacterized protein n=1 Tax=Crepidotus variabilis TaxID=179855 RepID=A0A9P6EER8_9AGAR|nr:hypothetical protein CPB83DRAFT_855541 [Crepidotus variabilis]
MRLKILADTPLDNVRHLSLRSRHSQMFFAVTCTELFSTIRKPDWALLAPLAHLSVKIAPLKLLARRENFLTKLRTYWTLIILKSWTPGIRV